ncbi:MAG: hypothetical protein E7246_01805 [Lachnoclostridium sp.]|nr:hypothetical protein [Lachnoclostridium sp.]
MRLIGIALMAAALTGVGFVLAERGKERLALLRQLRQMIHYMKSQILYSNATLPEAVFEVGNHWKGSERESENGWELADFFLNVGKRLNEKGNQTFSAIWQAEAENIPTDIPMTQGDREALGMLGNTLGYADRQMQERSLLFYLEQLDETMEGMKAEAEHLGKLYRTLGTAAGMFWFVLLI